MRERNGEPGRESSGDLEAEEGVGTWENGKGAWIQSERKKQGPGVRENNGSERKEQGSRAKERKERGPGAKESSGDPERERSRDPKREKRTGTQSEEKERGPGRAAGSCSERATSGDNWLFTSPG